MARPKKPADEPKHRKSVKPRSMQRQEGKHEPPRTKRALRKLEAERAKNDQEDES